MDTVAQPVALGRKRDHTRDPEILAAALDVLAEAGYDGMTIDMVATRAKAGKATLYRRWPSKAELVIDAVVCSKGKDIDPGRLPDTGTLRGDLIGLIRDSTIEDGERKLQIVSGLVSMIARSPELADAVRAAFVEPRVAAYRALLRRAVERGEVAPDVDVENVAGVLPALAMHRLMLLRKPMDRDFLVSVIDGVVLPAAGIRPQSAPGATLES